MIYDFRCSICGAIETDVVLSMRHTDDDHPKCCYSEPMQDYHTRAPYVAWHDRQLLDGGFKAAHDGTMITSVKQNKEYMKKNGLQDANEMYAPPTHTEQFMEHKKALASIDAITPTETEMSQLKDDGIVDGEGQIIN